MKFGDGGERMRERLGTQIEQNVDENVDAQRVASSFTVHRVHGTVADVTRRETETGEKCKSFRLSKDVHSDFKESSMSSTCIDYNVLVPW